ncbi:hypothetical protein DYB32_004524 [Aphanomyces invadans]|uniref:PX domain-containing protein n=1 Tax=Aphanomyces invadans TaxID=157072 RepID=A0A418AXJ3_9STRA|nr:hypothetical protein DYB32_004524 [Aphanomyces invadans]
MAGIHKPSPLGASQAVVVGTSLACHDQCAKQRLQEPPYLMPFHAAHPGDAEYSEYMAAWLHTNSTIRRVDNIVLYAVEVNLGKMRWTIHRRYSEFRELRQTMIKQMAKRTSCCICGSTLQNVEALQFPPRRLTLFTALSSADLDKRQTMLQHFVSMLVGMVQVLRQHQMLTETRAGLAKRNQTHYDVSDVLRNIETFFGLDFCRYTHFLAERGVLQPNEVLLA